jgi:hypothetical protein
VAWSTPIPELLLAYEAKVEFLRATNPFGSGKPADNREDETPEERAARIKASIRGRKGE